MATEIFYTWDAENLISWFFWKTPEPARINQNKLVIEIRIRVYLGVLTAALNNIRKYLCRRISIGVCAIWSWYWEPGKKNNRKITREIWEIDTRDVNAPARIFRLLLIRSGELPFRIGKTWLPDLWRVPADPLLKKTLFTLERVRSENKNYFWIMINPHLIAVVAVPGMVGSVRSASSGW